MLNAKINEPQHDKTNLMICAPSEDSDQPRRPPSLIRAFAVHIKKHWVLSQPLSAQRRLWSDWPNSQADMSFRWAHRPHCLFCHAAAKMQIQCIRSPLHFLWKALTHWYLNNGKFRKDIKNILIDRNNPSVILLKEFFFKRSFLCRIFSLKNRFFVFFLPQKLRITK